MCTYNVFINGEDTGIVIDAETDDDAWEQVSNITKNKGKNIELLQI